MSDSLLGHKTGAGVRRRLHARAFDRSKKELVLGNAPYR